MGCWDFEMKEWEMYELNCVTSFKLRKYKLFYTKGQTIIIIPSSDSEIAIFEGPICHSCYESYYIIGQYYASLNQ